MAYERSNSFHYIIRFAYTVILQIAGVCGSYYTYTCTIQAMHQVNSTVTEITEFANRTCSFTSSGVELLNISLLFSVKTRTIPLNLIETLRNHLGNGRNNIFPNGVLLKNKSGIEVLAFQPNCK